MKYANVSNTEVAQWLLKNPQLVDNYKARELMYTALLKKIEKKYGFRFGIVEQILNTSKQNPWTTEVEAIQIVEAFFDRNQLNPDKMKDFNIARSYTAYLYNIHEGELCASSNLSDTGLIYLLFYLSDQFKEWEACKDFCAALDLHKKTLIGLFTVRRFKNGRLILTAPPDCMVRLAASRELGKKTLYHPVTNSPISW